MKDFRSFVGVVSESNNTVANVVSELIGKRVNFKLEKDSGGKFQKLEIDVTNKMGLKMFANVSILIRPITRGGDTFLKVEYQTETFNHGMNGTDIASIKIDGDGNVMETKNLLE